MRNFAFTALGGILALVIFVLGSLFGEFINTIKGSKDAQKTEQIAQNELEINEQIEFSIKAKPDLYKANPSFYADELSDEDKSTINARFTGILTLVKENGLCSGGAYETYSEHTQNAEAKTRLSSKLNCSFKENELEKYNELISGIENLLKSSPVKLHLAKINPTFSDEAKLKNNELIKNGLIQKAKENAEVLSQNFAKNCELKNIDFGYLHLVGSNTLTASSDGAKIAAPELSEQTISANVGAKYLCK